MEQKNATRATKAQLRDAGASRPYIAYYKQAKRMGKHTASTRHAEKVVFDGVEYSGGGFHDSLWNDEPRFPNGPNPYGADGTNKEILQAAGVYRQTE